MPADALAEIVKTMGSTIESVGDPCESGYLGIPDSRPGTVENKVDCHCNQNSICHITTLYSFLFSVFAFSFLLLVTQKI